MGERLGDHVRRLRKDHGLTLDQLAAKARISKSYLWEIEADRVPRPSANKLGQLALVLGTTVDGLLGQKTGVGDGTAPEDLAFFRKFTSLPEDDKEKFRRMIDIWDD